MRVDKKENIVIIKAVQDDFISFVIELKNKLHNYKQKNIIVDLTSYSDLTLETILLFNDLSKQHKFLKKSFVLVVSDFYFDQIPDEITVVPSVLEARDIIEMEEIERDLGL